MPKLEIPILARPDIAGLVRSVRLSQPQMRVLGDLADDLMDKRVDSDTPENIFGQPRPELSPSYKRRKIREGRRGVRDMRRTGKTLAAKNVIATDETDSEVSATVGIKGSAEFRKALFSQNADPWFGLTAAEEKTVYQRAEDIFEENIKRANAR
jgi:hypothetical protein